ncbi:MAG: sulfatase-like hydrolase/transferase [Candidatus Latescibacteria bacterium]|nr:sulfatase-like hydrolase/transferase [Candidatus Latescibacterota bacterium]
MNIIYVNPDEMRADVLGCYGHPLVQTPNFDRLAAEGTRFQQCHVQHTVCTPSRCSFMTGWYPHTRGHRTLWHPLQPDEPNTMRYMKSVGYDVHWIGKNDCLSPGSFASSVSRVHRVSGGGNSRNAFAEGEPGFFSFLNEALDSPPRDAACFERAIEVVRKRKTSDPPFFLFLATSFPHPIYHAPQPWHDMYDPADIPPLRPADLEGKPAFHRLIRAYRELGPLDDMVLRRIMAVYLGMVSYVDHLLGKLLDALDESGLADETAVVAFSDHGDWAGDYGLVEKWPSALDDCLTRVPLLIRAPGYARGHVVEEPVACMDIMPTTLQLAGIECGHTHAARSLIPQLEGECGDSQRAVFAEGGYDLHEPHCFEGRPEDGVCGNPKSIYFPKGKQQQEHPESVCRSTMIRTIDHKLIRRTNGEHELYHMAHDPLELCNVYGASEYEQTRRDLEQRMLDWYMETSDVTPWTPDPRGFPRSWHTLR